MARVEEEEIGRVELSNELTVTVLHPCDVKVVKQKIMVGLDSSAHHAPLNDIMSMSF